jgi:hypothetical protein
MMLLFVPLVRGISGDACWVPSFADARGRREVGREREWPVAGLAECHTGKKERKCCYQLRGGKKHVHSKRASSGYL